MLWTPAPFQPAATWEAFQTVRVDAVVWAIRMELEPGEAVLVDCLNI
jgi:hypothetical protein